jgi:hypothetical protein
LVWFGRNGSSPRNRTRPLLLNSCFDEQNIICAI